MTTKQAGEVAFKVIWWPCTHTHTHTHIHTHTHTKYRVGHRCQHIHKVACTSLSCLWTFSLCRLPLSWKSMLCSEANNEAVQNWVKFSHCCWGNANSFAHAKWPFWYPQSFSLILPSKRKNPFTSGGGGGGYMDSVVTGQNFDHLFCVVHPVEYIVEPLYNGHPWDPKFCPL